MSSEDKIILAHPCTRRQITWVVTQTETEKSPYKVSHSLRILLQLCDGACTTPDQKSRSHSCGRDAFRLPVEEYLQIVRDPDRLFC